MTRLARNLLGLLGIVLVVQGLGALVQLLFFKNGNSWYATLHFLAPGFPQVAGSIGAAVAGVVVLVLTREGKNRGKSTD